MKTKSYEVLLEFQLPIKQAAIYFRQLQISLIEH